MTQPGADKHEGGLIRESTTTQVWRRISRLRRSVCWYGCASSDHGEKLCMQAFSPAHSSTFFAFRRLGLLHLTQGRNHTALSLGRRLGFPEYEWPLGHFPLMCGTQENNMATEVHHTPLTFGPMEHFTHCLKHSETLISHDEHTFQLAAFQPSGGLYGYLRGLQLTGWGQNPGCAGVFWSGEDQAHGCRGFGQTFSGARRGERKRASSRVIQPKNSRRTA